MGINQFFEVMLNAPVRNPRWSWGAADTLNSRVYLRVWSDHIADGKVRVGYESLPDARPGFGERQKHIELIRRGSKGYGVVCKAVDTTTSGAREIQSFDSEELLEFGEIVGIDGETFGTVVGRVPVQALDDTRSSESRIIEDLDSVEELPIPQTDKEQLVLARIGQGKYRTDLLERWDYSCAVTGAETLCAIRASHIRPWKDCTDKQRVDPENGIPLIASLDALFDKGLISFEDSGKMIVSCNLLPKEHQYFHIGNACLRRTPSKRMTEYLEFHRREKFDK